MRLNPFRKRRGRAAARESWLSPEAKRAAFGVVFIVFGLILLLSFFSAAGPTGQALLASTRRLFGYVTYIVPVLAAVFGWYLVRPPLEEVSRLRIIAAALTALGLLGFLHSIPAVVSEEDALQYALDGGGGGLTGFALAWPLRKAFSDIAAFLIFFATTLAGFFLTFNISPGQLWEMLRGLVPIGRTDDEESDEESDEDTEETEDSPMPMFRISRMTRGNADPNQLRLEEQRAAEEEQRQRLSKHVSSVNRRYRPPSLDLLHSSVGRPDSGNVEENKRKIHSTLEKFGIAVTMKKEHVGPTVTQYTLIPHEGVKLSRITALQNDLALALAAHPIRIEAPIPNTNLVGIEIPNKNVSLVRLRDLISAKEFRKSAAPLTIGMGKDVAGRVRVANIESMPHILIAGATGAGKSIFINTLIVSLLYRNSPALVRFLLVDPKRVELSLYNGIPHLLHPVIIEPEKTINALKWAVREMDRRYRLLSDSGARNLMSFNANNPEETLPMIVIVIDELADLMATHARDVEGAIVRLSQMARAIGIHLVLATQRPSVNVITGLIKANVPTRVAFNVASQVDSRTILDAAGADKLLGSGDMLYLPGDQAKPTRIQGSFISEEEVRAVVNDIVQNNDIPDDQYDDEITVNTKETIGANVSGADDDLFEDAKQVVVESGKASTSLLQRRLRVGYSRAARLMDMLEEQNIIGAPEGNKPREVLVQFEDDLGSDEYVEGDEEAYEPEDYEESQ